jgi:hypothetical protein
VSLGFPQRFAGERPLLSTPKSVASNLLSLMSVLKEMNQCAPARHKEEGQELKLLRTYSVWDLIVSATVYIWITLVVFQEFSLMLVNLVPRNPILQTRKLKLREGGQNVAGMKSISSLLSVFFYFLLHVSFKMRMKRNMV